SAIITGAGRGIGKAIALRLARDGFDICVNDTDASLVDQLGRTAIDCIADVSDRAAVDNLVEKSVAALGPLTVMVANAGITQPKPLLELTDADIRRIFDVNVIGVYNCYASAAKQMIKQGTPGKIIGGASIAAFKAPAEMGHYGASKFAVRGWTQAFAQELGKHNITVTAYAPGLVDTEIWNVNSKEAIFKKCSDEMIALKRIAMPEDVAKFVSFLASTDSDYITGQTIAVDGGIIYN
ncbi:unnamed protein product, partial [Didymodactylos carnosus]